MNEREDAELEELMPALAQLASDGGRDGASEAAGCPDELTLAGYAEERLLDDERDALEAHLARCGRCRAGVIALARQPPTVLRLAPPVAPRISAVRRQPMAALLVAACLIALVAWWWSRREPAPPADALVAAVDALARDDPFFAGFRPLSLAELGDDPRRTERGGALRGLVPRGTIDEERPRVEWEPAPLAASFDVSIVDAAGRRVLEARATTNGLDWPQEQPPLARGADFVLAVVAQGPLGEERRSAAFHVASADEAEETQRALAAIEREVDAPLSELVKAHWLLRRRRFGAAAVAARRWLEQRPDDADGRLALFQALAQLDASEADAFAPRRQ